MPKAKLAYSVGKQNQSSSVAELKGHEHVVNAVTISIKRPFIFYEGGGTAGNLGSTS